MCRSEGYLYGKAACKRFSAAASLVLLEYLGKACPPDGPRCTAQQLLISVVGICVQVGTSNMQGFGLLVSKVQQQDVFEFMFLIILC